MSIVSAFVADLRHAGRALRRAPGFTVAAGLTLALGIGATTAVFSVVQAVLLRPLPYGEPDRIVGVWNSWDGNAAGLVSPGEYLDYAREVSAFEHIGLTSSGTATLTLPNGEPERVGAAFVTHGVLAALGVTPMAGAIFTADDDRPGGNDKAILGETLWRRTFSAAPDLIGKRIVLDGRSLLVVGVMPASFRLPSEFAAREPTQIFLPLAFDAERATVRGNHSFRAVARLRPGVTVAAASAEVGRVAARFSRDMPGEYPPRMQFAARATPITDEVTGSVRPALLLLLGAIGFVLLIAGTNVTNLFLSRAEFHAGDGAIRSALGASRGHLISYVLAESVLVAGAGGAAGLALAAAGIRALSWLQPGDLPRSEAIALDWPVLAFALTLSIAVGIIVAIVPASRAAALAPQQALGTHTRSVAAAGRPRLRQLLIAAQVALSIMLLLGAALLATSFQRLMAVDPGYQTERLVAVDLSLPDSTYASSERTTAFFASLLETLRQQPGVQAAGAVANLPLATGGGDINLQIAGRETAPGTPSRRADWQVVTPGYLETIGTRLLRGRTIAGDDRADTPGVVVISESMARQDWPGTDPIGSQFRLGGGAGPGVVSVVGVVADIRHRSLADEPRRQMYLAHTQFRFWGGSRAPARDLTVVTRTVASPVALASLIRREVRALDPTLPLGAVRTMSEVRAASVAGPRLLAILISSFSITALAIAVVGIFGIVSYSVAQRRREIGVRLALGAAPRAVTGLVVWQGMLPAAAGIAIGLGGGVVFSGVLRAFLFQVSPRDPAVAIGVSLLVGCIALLACLLPARRAGLIDPMVALRPE